MNKNDVAKLLYVVKANYPKFYHNMDKAELLNLVDVWHSCLLDYDYDIAQAGLKIYFSTERSGFPPSVGQIIDCIHKILSMEDDGISEVDAWRIVFKAICNANYNAEREFERLPDLLKRVVGSPDTLREWAQLEEKDVQTITSSNFMRSFTAIKKSKREYLKIPSDVQKIIDAHIAVIKKQIDSEKDIVGISNRDEWGV